MDMSAGAVKRRKIDKSSYCEDIIDDKIAHVLTSIVSNPLHASDPLTAWLECIQAATAETAVALRQACARRFIDDPRFANDPRLLRVWMLHAQDLERGGEDAEGLFSLMSTRGIGARHTSFWIAWSHALEARGRCVERVFSCCCLRFERRCEIEKAKGPLSTQ